MNDDLKKRLAVFLLDWRLDAEGGPLKRVTPDEALAIILDAIKAAGYAIVPKEPTIEMVVAGGDLTDRPRKTYSAMLAAAPKVKE
jgi:hypothetical protein